jgi:hypothetical protein
MAERLEHVTLTVTTTGTAGSAAGSAVSPIFVNGAEVLRVWWDYHASAPSGTTDVSLYETALGATLGAIDAKANSATDAVRYPRLSSFQDLAGADLSANEVTEPYRLPAGGSLTAAVAQCDALTAAAVCRVLVRRF